MQQPHISTYSGGMNKDFSPDSNPPQFYIDALDMRITTVTGESNEAVMNMRGNKFVTSLPVIGEIVIGATSIRDTIVLFTTTSYLEEGGWGAIRTITYNREDDTLGALNTYYQNPEFGFSALHPIEAYGIYENPEIQRIYWVDDYNDYRAANIGAPSTGLTPDDFSVFPNVTMAAPVIEDITSGGNLVTGSYQYSYRLTTTDGKETILSPPSNIIHIVEDLESASTSADYMGNEQGVQTSKAVKVKIDGLDISSYKYITLIAIYRENYKGTPAVLEVETVEVIDSTMTLTHSGNENASFPLTLSDFTFTQYPFKSAKTIASKDDLLVVANTRREVFDLDIDMSTKRYRSNGATYSDVYKNPYNNLTTAADDLDINNHYKYQSDGVTLGGEGTYIDYKFTLEPIRIDSAAQNGTTMFATNPSNNEVEWLNDGYNDINNFFGGHASPQISGQYRGYKRGETYRFGIVFYNKKNVPSYVKWIGDIKMPEIGDQLDSPLTVGGKTINNFSTAISDGTNIYGLCLGVEFRVKNLAPSILAQFERYQIVRVDRDLNNSTRVCQGFINKYHAPTGGSNVDFMSYINGQNAANSGSGKPEWGCDTIKTYKLGAGSNNILDNYISSGVPGYPNYNPNIQFGKFDYISFFSPEVSYKFNAPAANSQDFLRFVGAFTIYNSTNSESVSEQVSKGAADAAEEVGTINTKFNTVIPISTPFNSVRQQSIIFSKIASPSFAEFDINSDTVRNYVTLMNNGGGITDIERVGFQGTNLFCNTTTGKWGIDSYASVSDESISSPLIEYVKYVSEQYGGQSEEAIANNTFIAATRTIDKVNYNQYIRVYGGDIFIGMVDILRAFNDEYAADRDFGNTPSATDPIRVNVTVPVESTINLDLVHGQNIHRDGLGPNDEYDITEWSYKNQTGGYYIYNETFSNENDIRVFIPKPILSQDTEVYDYRAYYSFNKTNGELIDNWAKYGFSNNYDVDSKYGPINRIISMRDQIYFLQDTGVGYYAINPRATVSTSEGVPTQLGSGQGFVDHHYMSTNTGTIHQFGVIATEDSVYYLDAINKKIMTFSAGQGVQPMSDIGGLHGYLNNNLIGAVLRKRSEGGDVPGLNIGAYMGYDRVNREVYLTVLGNVVLLDYGPNTTYPVGSYIQHGTDFYIVDTEFTTGDIPVAIGDNQNTTILQTTVPGQDTDTFTDALTLDFPTETKPGVFTRPTTVQELFNGGDVPNPVPTKTFNEGFTLIISEFRRAFMTFHTPVPRIYFGTEEHLMTPYSLNNEKVYIHNKGSYGVFYDDDPTECSITLLVNPHGDINKILRFIEFNSKVTDSVGTIDRDSTITAFRVTSSDIGGQYQDTSKTAFSVDRVKRRFEKWRVKIPRDINSTNQRGRLRSTWFYVTLYYDNQADKELVLNRILSHYDIQML